VIVDERSKVQILLADDHEMVREALRRLLNDQDDMLVVGEARSGEEALRLVQALTPAVALVDVSMPGGGVQLTRALAQACPTLKVVAVTRHSDPAFVTAMLQAGAAGYVLKQSPSAELTRTIRAVAAGVRYVDASIEPAAENDAPAATASSSSNAPPAPLSPLEEQVLRLVAASHSNRDIAEELALDVTDVASLKASAMEKAGLATRVDAIRYAESRGWMPRN